MQDSTLSAELGRQIEKRLTGGRVHEGLLDCYRFRYSQLDLEVRYTKSQVSCIAGESHAQIPLDRIGNI